MIRFAIISFFVLLFVGPAFGQAPEKLFVGNCSFSGFVLVSDSTYTGDIIRFDDRMGDGYNLTQLQAGDEIFDGRGLVFEIDVVNSATNFTADVTVTAKVDRGFEPFGSGQVYRPTAAGLIPPSSQEQAGLSPTQKARIDRHNVVTMQSLIGDRDTVYSITNVSDTSTLSPRIGYIFVNSTADTLGVYDGDGWVLFSGGGSTEQADGLTILGAGTGGDPFRVDTALMATTTALEDSLFTITALVDSISGIKISFNYLSNIQIKTCETTAPFFVTGRIDDPSISVGDDISGDITWTLAGTAVTYIQEEDGWAYYEILGNLSAGVSGPTFGYSGVTLNPLISVLAGFQDTVTVFDPPGQDSILVTRVCGTEVSRDTVDVQHPFSTTSAELEISGGELRMNPAGANLGDAWRYNGVDAFEPAPVNSIEYLTSNIEVTVCNDADTCDYTSLNAALEYASLFTTSVYDSLEGLKRLTIRIRPNPSGSKTVLTDKVLIEGGSFRNIRITSVYQGVQDTVYWNSGGDAYSTFLRFTSCTPPDLDSITIIQQYEGVSTYCIQNNSCNNVNWEYVNIDSFAIAMYFIDQANAFIRHCNFNNSAAIAAFDETAIWFEGSTAYLRDLTVNNFARSANFIRQSRVELINSDFFNWTVNGINLSGSRLTIQGVDVRADGATETDDDILLSTGAILSYFSGSGGTSEDINRMTNNGIVFNQSEPYNFQESSTAGEPSVAKTRYYYNTDDNRFKISDGVSTWRDSYVGTVSSNTVPYLSGGYWSDSPMTILGGNDVTFADDIRMTSADASIYSYLNFNSIEMYDVAGHMRFKSINQFYFNKSINVTGSINFTGNLAITAGSSITSTNIITPYEGTGAHMDFKMGLTIGDWRWFNDVPTQVMTLKHNGNLGINETSPDAKLEVVGEAIITSTIYLNAAKTVGIFSGTGSPESSVTASVGSTYHRTDGGAGTSYYVKESGTGNTGWIAK